MARNGVAVGSHAEGIGLVDCEESLLERDYLGLELVLGYHYRALLVFGEQMRWSVSSLSYNLPVQTSLLDSGILDRTQRGLAQKT